MDPSVSLAPSEMAADREIEVLKQYIHATVCPKTRSLVAVTDRIRSMKPGEAGNGRRNRPRYISIPASPVVRASTQYVVMEYETRLRVGV